MCMAATCTDCILPLQVILKPADVISFVPHPQHDLLQYNSLSHLTQQISQQGFYGGIRLLMVRQSSSSFEIQNSK